MVIFYFKYVVVLIMTKDNLRLETQLIDLQIENIKLKKEIEKLRKAIKIMRER